MGRGAHVTFLGHFFVSKRFLYVGASTARVFSTREAKNEPNSPPFTPSPFFILTTGAHACASIGVNVFGEGVAGGEAGSFSASQVDKTRAVDAPRYIDRSKARKWPQTVTCATWAPKGQFGVRGVSGPSWGHAAHVTVRGHFIVFEPSIYLGASAARALSTR